MPSTALALLECPDNFSIYSAHRFFIPAMEALIRDVRIDGFINPGHVSTILGVKAYEKFVKYGIPQVISGFEAEDVILSIYMLVKAIVKGESILINEYSRAVRYEGNLKAQKVMKKVFDVEDAEWRGLGIISNSGAVISKNYEDHDALKIFEDVFDNFTPKEDVRKKACICGEILKGKALPRDCKLFMNACNPRNPIGACMVSFEGTCNIWAKYAIR